jgi:iron complex transport system permease protein
LNLNRKYYLPFVLLVITVVVVALANLSLGSVAIPLRSVIGALANDPEVSSTWKTIILDYRLPKLVTALLAGSGLAVSGLLMQTLFRNPLAGPFVLGISSGASLGVALLLMGGTMLGGAISYAAYSSWGIAVAASLGALLVLVAVLLAAYKIRNTMSILIIGLMFGSITAAVISVLAYFSTANQLQQYLFWSFGSLGNLTWQEIQVLFFLFLAGTVLILFIIKPLNSLLIGENYAKSMGVNVLRTRTITLVATSILTGVITAFSGPIAFIGLAVPHLTKLVFNTSNHKILLPAVALLGAGIMLVCDSIAQLPYSEFTLPINAITSLFGAPIVIWLLVRKHKMYF